MGFRLEKQQKKIVGTLARPCHHKHELCQPVCKTTKSRCTIAHGCAAGGTGCALLSGCWPSLKDWRHGLCHHRHGLCMICLHKIFIFLASISSKSPFFCPKTQSFIYLFLKLNNL